MSIVRKFMEHIFDKNSYKMIILIFINLFIYLFKFTLYRQVTELISQIQESFNDNFYSILFNYFVKLMFSHIVFNISYFLLEKQVVLKTKKLFNEIVKRMLCYKVEFFKHNNNNKISQLWFYLSSVEILMEKCILELPKIITFLLYYTYTIYTFTPKAIFVIVPINLFILYCIHPLSKKQFLLQQSRVDLDLDTKNKLLETTSNIEFVKLNNKQNWEIERINGSFNKYSKNKIKDRNITTIISTISAICDDIFVFIIYLIGAGYVLSGTMKPIDLLYLAVHTGNFYYQVTQLKEIYNYYKRIYPKLDIIYEILFYNDKEDIYKLEMNNGKYNRLKNEDIIFYNVSFAYEKNQPILNNLSFKFKNNKINLLLGPNGSGKSTIVKLLMRLYELENSESNNIIYYKGSNIKNMTLAELRNKITFVSHEPPIFDDTVMENIKYGNEEISELTILDMAELLDSKKWIIENKDKLTGFRGRNLSGGEKKKIQLLNSICKRTDVIIFDEPSNALDSNAIRWFIDFVKKLRDVHKKTIIIITHDLRMVDMSDHIVDLNHL